MRECNNSWLWAATVTVKLCSGLLRPGGAGLVGWSADNTPRAPGGQRRGLK